jgi:EAL domain-containing protein (putative c-di-GMP-specific phosphodiesterase class I)
VSRLDASGYYAANSTKLQTPSSSAIARSVRQSASSSFGLCTSTATLIHTLVQLGKALSIETFAEGIEEQRELSLLRDEDCDSGQGFLFARPLDAAAARESFSSWHATARRQTSLGTSDTGA